MSVGHVLLARSVVVTDNFAEHALDTMKHDTCRFAARIARVARTETHTHEIISTIVLVSIWEEYSGQYSSSCTLAAVL